MRVLSDAEALTHPGSLLSPDGKIVAPYDLQRQDGMMGPYRSFADVPGVRNGAARPFTLDYATVPAVHIVNGMGVALGDSVMGLTAIDILRHINPALRCVLYRPARAPAHTEALYRLAAGVVADMRWLPQPLADLPTSECVIDLGNQLFWPDFACMPMIDFFLSSLGVDPRTVPAAAKRNQWVQRLCLPDPASDLVAGDYVLFCPAASTPIRSIPENRRRGFVDRLWRRFRMPVVGFGAVDHPHYVDARALSPDTGTFMAWIKGAHFLFSADTAAVHIAAGFDVPTTALFTTIRPDFRVRDYPRCEPISVEPAGLQGVHASSRSRDLARLDVAFSQFALTGRHWSIGGRSRENDAD